MSNSEKQSAGISLLSDGLPSYEELRAERALKDTFAKVVKDHEEIEKLFLSVAAQLETTPKIGEGHDLCKEWNQLRKKHRKLYRDSQLNASQCASFLRNFSDILVPLSKSKMTMREKTFMINKFLDAIPAHQDAARDVATRFQELGKEVEVFPVKVSCFLRSEADSGGFWQSIWSGVEDLCMAIWSVLHRLLSAIISLFQSVLGLVKGIRFSCGPFISVDIELQGSSTVPSRGSTRSSFRRAQDECDEIKEHLGGFEDAWHLVRLSCDNLLQNMTMANGLSSIPLACDAHIKAASGVYNPLIQCLSAYAAGKSPLAFS